jgi:PAS domain S-box-containing protein
MADRLSVLIVEDSQNDAFLVRRTLEQQGYEVIWERVETPEDMVRALKHTKWDLVISDYCMPKFSAPAALRLLQENELDIPFIVISGTVGEEVAVETMRMGAHDYLLKGNLTRLGEAIRREMREAEIRVEHKNSIKKIGHLNEVLRSIRNVNELIVREKDPRRLIDQACKLLVETRGYHGAWIALARDGGLPWTLSGTGWGGAFEPFAQGIKDGGRLLCRERALASEEKLAILDPTNDCGNCPLRSGYGNAAAVVATLTHGEETVGLLGIATTQGFSMDSEERSLFLEVAGDLAYALHTLESEERRREGELRYQDMVETTSDWIWEVDSQGRYTYSSPKVLDILGYLPAEVIGRTPFDLMPAEEARRVGAIFAEIVAARRPFAALQNTNCHKNGKLVVVESSGVPVFGPNNEFRGYRGVDRNITERIRVENERQRLYEDMARSEKRFKSIFNSSRDGILLADAATRRFQLANDSICQMLGYTREEIQGLEVAQIHSAKDLPAVIEAFEKQRRREIDVAPDIPVQRKDGSVFYADINSALVELDGKTYIMGLFRDVTEKRNLQASLAQSDRLASMGMLAAGVAHEINNPLTYILYNLQSLSEDLPKLADGMRRCYSELSVRVGVETVGKLVGDKKGMFNLAMFEDAVERLREALAGTNRIKDITQGLGTFSRVEAVEVAPVYLQHAIEHAVDMACNEIKYRARLIKDFRQVPAVLASDGKLAQVFLNLLVNAAHAIVEGDVEGNEIHVRTWAEGDQVFGEVRDTGNGIPPEHYGRIFEPFFTTKGVGVGSGLGLSICRNIVTGFGGKISFESEVGKGTRFLVQLPVIPHDWETRKESSLACEPVGPKVRGRILVVDDEAEIRKVMVSMLGREHDVVAASSGVEGQALLERDQTFDLLFFDLMMPQKSGMDLHEWLAQRNPALAGQVVFITGGAFTPRAREYLAKVGNLRVEKPFDPVNFRKMAGELVLASKAKNRT